MYFKAIILAMKLTAFFLVVFCLHANAKAVAQRVTLSEKNVPLHKILDDIRRQTGYTFFYNESLLESIPNLSVRLRDVPLPAALDSCLKDQPLAYSFIGNNIVIKKKVPAEPDPQPDAPPITVRGVVLDENNFPLEGASVLIKGTESGTFTNAAGEFSLTIPENVSRVLVISFVGKQPQEIALGGRTELRVKLSPLTSEQEEIVVVGYTSQKRRNLTSAVGIADVESMQKKSVTDVAQALQGTVAGVNIAASNGNPGAEMHINIRGISSFSGDNRPLVIVDGVQVEGGLRELNANDIKSIQVLKDASSAAIYGSRAANGVILVSTKTGERNASRAQVTYQNYVGVQLPYKGIDVANSRQYIQILQRMYGEDLGGDELIPQAARDYLANPANFRDYNWQKEIYTAAPMQNHDLAISGGGRSGTYRVSVGYIDQDGITLATGYRRANVRANTEFFVNDNIKIGQSLALSKSATENEPYSFSRSVYSQAIKMYPYFAPKLPNGDWQTSSFYYGGGDNPEALIRNPFHYNSIWDGEQTDADISLNMYAEVKVLQALTYKISGSFSQGNSLRRNYFGDKGQFQDEYFDPNLSLEESEATSYNWNIDNTVRYQRNFGKHAVDATAGFVSQLFGYRYLTGGKEGFLSDITSTLDGPGGKNPYVEGGKQESALVSFIGQVFYAYNDRYLLTVNFRRDGSSRFAPDYRWGNFPGISVGWRLSKEGFWQHGNVRNAVTDLKIRAGYGVLGRQNLGNYDYIPVLNYVPAEFDGSVQDGLITGTPINEAISWERLISKTIGVDYELFNGRLSGSFDYYNNDSRDMIIGLAIAPSVGGGELQSNAGLINNRGFEMALGYHGQAGEFNYNVGFNLGTTRTRLINIGRELVEGDSPEWDVPHAIEIHQGGGLAEYWLIRTNGLFRTQEEIDNYTDSRGNVIQPNARPGDIRFVDANDDGQITPEGDRQYSGSGVPRVNAGFSFTGNYKNFDVHLGVTGAFGQVIYNATRYLVEQNYGFANFSTALLNAFDPTTNPNSDFPRLNPNDVDDNWNSRPTSDRYMEKGGYVKVRNLEFGYRLPAATVQRVKISSVRVFIRGQNLLNITKYTGADPEVGSSPIINDDPIFTAGLDRDTAPQARSVQLGLNVSF